MALTTALASNAQIQIGITNNRRSLGTFAERVTRSLNDKILDVYADICHADTLDFFDRPEAKKAIETLALEFVRHKVDRLDGDEFAVIVDSVLFGTANSYRSADAGSS